MKPAKLKRLHAAGWKALTVKEFLQLSDEEAMLVDVKLAMADAVKAPRKTRGLSKIGLAKRMSAKQKLTS